MIQKTESRFSQERSVNQKEDTPESASSFNYYLLISRYAAPVSQPRKSIALTTLSMATM